MSNAQIGYDLNAAIALLEGVGSKLYAAGETGAGDVAYSIVEELIALASSGEVWRATANPPLARYYKKMKKTPPWRR